MDLSLAADMWELFASAFIFGLGMNLVGGLVRSVMVAVRTVAV